MTRISEYYGLRKTQSELDFVDVFIDRDTRLFIDPYAISCLPGKWAHDAHRLLITYFQLVVDRIRQGKDGEARELLSHLGEPQETRLGMTKFGSSGAGVGPTQAEAILQALRRSSAVKQGFLNALEECELMVPNIGQDKISDLATNIIRSKLIEYTEEQAELHNMPTSSVAAGSVFSLDTHRWEGKYANLPVINGMPLLLVPKAIVRYRALYDHQKYYRHYVLNFLKAETLRAGSSLIRTLRDGTQVVYKTDLEAVFPCTKEFLFEFSAKYPEVLADYRDSLKAMHAKGQDALLSPHEQADVASLLREMLKSIPAGQQGASEYHSYMIGAIELLFFPHLIRPVKETPIHEGRKRIDIVMENAAVSGIFIRLPNNMRVPCAYVPFECKNYKDDVANPELDQLSSRLSFQRGLVGFLCCRKLGNRGLFVERCRDTYKDGRGVIIALDDEELDRLLAFVESRDRDGVEERISDLVREICLS